MKSVTWFLAACLLFSGNASICHGGRGCISRNGLEVCVEARGTCALHHLLSNEANEPEMEIILVTIVNHSTSGVTISPHSFHAVTTTGLVVTVDAPLFDAIQWKNKLKEASLGPRGQVRGSLFFPTCLGRITTLVYRGNPSFQIRLL